MGSGKPFDKTVDGMIVVARATKEAAELAPFPFVKGAVGSLVVLLETIRQVRANKENVLLLAEDANKFVQTIKHEITNAPPKIDPNLQHAVEKFVEELNGIVATVQTLAGRGFFKRVLLHASDADDISDAQKSLDQSFKTFMVATHFQIRAEQRRIAHVQLLAGLQVASARWNESKKCYDGTRLKLLDEIRAWSRGEGQFTKPIYWLADVAGSGKSTIANHVASEWKKNNQLGGCFFFSQNAADRKDLKLFWSTISSHLVEFHSDLRDSVGQAIEQNPTVASMPFEEQFEILIQGPLGNAKEPLVFVIDALDECDVDTRSTLVKLLLDIPKASLPIKFFVTARPERDITNAIEESGQHRAQFDVHGQSNKADVQQYVQTELNSLANPRKTRGWSGPTAREVAAIADRAGGLFIWASTACKLIKDSASPKKQLSRLINDPSLESLDKLYLEALNQAAPASDPISREEVASILHVIVTALEPLSIDAIEELLEVDNAEIVVRRLGSVLSSSERRTEPVRILHPTFLEFLNSADRCTDPSFRVDVKGTHARLSSACFTSLQTLRQDMFDIKEKDKGLLNAEIPNLDEKVAGSLTEPLRYACRFWADHAAESISEKEIQTSTLAFFKRHFLHWLECLSLMLRVREGVSALRKLETHVKRNQTSDRELQLWCYDGLKFVQTHQNVIQLSAPHVYISALAFSPPSSLIRKHYAPSQKKLPVILRGQDPSWSTSLTLEGHTSSISRIIFSPDGSRLISGSWDQSVRMWEVMSGAPLGEAMRGHNGSILCMDLTKDGTRIVSAGSGNCHIRLWDAIAGVVVGGSLEGHWQRVTCIAFSPDGNRFASGCDDKRVLLWDTSSGSIVGDLRGHTDNVTCLLYSPDGSQVISASDDKTLRVWDAASGSAIGEPLEGHTSRVKCLAISQDGSRIASGSEDGTILLWDPSTRTTVGEPLTGHTDDITCINFSPNGSLLVSSSSDKTIRIWDASTGAAVGDALEGHIASVKCVAFSPDGTKIASGSPDHSLRLWNVSPVAQLGRVLASSDIECLAFSPNGEWVAAGALDGTIRLWNTSGINQIIEGDSQVDSMALSPDGTRIATGCYYPPTIRIWDTETGAAIGSPIGGGRLPLMSLSFSSDGSEIIGRHGNKQSHWKLPDSQSVLPTISASGPVKLPAVGSSAEPEQTRMALADDGWIYTNEDHRLLYLPPLNRGAWTARGPFFLTASGLREMTIIDCSRLLK